MPNEVVNGTENLYDGKIDSLDGLKDLLKANGIESDDDRTKVSELIKTKVEDEINRKKDESETSDAYKNRVSGGKELINMEEQATLKAIDEFRANQGKKKKTKEISGNSQVSNPSLEGMKHGHVVEVVNNDIDVEKLESIIADIKKTGEVDKEMNGYIESDAKNGLLSIKGQCLKIIESFKGDDLNKEVTAKAILALLKINQVLGIVRIDGGDPINLNGNCLDQLVNLIGTKEFDFTKILGPEEGNIVAAACEKGKKLLQKPSKEKQQKMDVWNHSKNEISYLKDVSEGLTGDGVSGAFVELRNNFNEKGNEAERKRFEKAVFTLIQKCCPKIKGICTDENEEGYTKLEKNFYSDKVKEFQQAVFDKSKEEGVDVEYKKAWEDLSQGIKPSERAIDGKLGRNTLNCLVWSVTKGLEFKPKEFEEKEGKAKLKAGIEKKETGASLEKMPLTFASFMQFGTLSEEGGFKVFKFKDNPGESDFVKKELGSNKKYVEISGKQFYIEGGAQEELQFRNIHVVHKGRDADGNIVPIKTTELCFGKFDAKGNFIDGSGSKVIIDSDGNRISSLLITEIKDQHGNVINLGVKTMGGKKKTFDKDGKTVDKQVVKRRIDVFGKEGNDTKEMSEEQINTILANPEACKVVLDLAINAYGETMHKPSSIGIDNLNKIVDGILKNLKDVELKNQLKQLDGVGYRGYFDEGLSAHDRVCRFLGLTEGLKSNPENKINKTDLSVDQSNQFRAKEKASDRRKFRSKLKQYKRIVDRLGLLKDILDKKGLDLNKGLGEQQKS